MKIFYDEGGKKGKYFELQDVEDFPKMKKIKGIFEEIAIQDTIGQENFNFNYSLENVIDGSYAFYWNWELVSFNSNLSKLENGVEMFHKCDNLTTFSIELPNLTYGDSMFDGCENLTSFSSDLHSLIDGSWMFYNCDNLTSFNSNLSSLKCGYAMFYDCSLDTESLINITNTINDISGLDKANKEHWKYEVLGETKTISGGYRGRIDIGNNYTEDVIMELYEKGWDVNSKTTNLNPTLEHTYEITKMSGYIPDASSWNTEQFDKNTSVMRNITKVENGYAWNNSTKLFRIRHQKLKNANHLFYQNYEFGQEEYLLGSFTTWNADLPLLEAGWYMFQSCKDLTTFNGDLSSLKKGNSMFNCCYKLSSFTTTNLDSLTEGEWMFAHSAITSFNTSMKSLQNGQDMFMSCGNLSSFSSDLSSLVCGSFMFRLCENLTSFYSTSLKSLLTGGQMFEYCRLNADSLNHISSVIKDISGMDKTNAALWKYWYNTGYLTIAESYRGLMTVTVDSSVTETQKNNFVSAMNKKGWTVSFVV